VQPHARVEDDVQDVDHDDGGGARFVVELPVFAEGEPPGTATGTSRSRTGCRCFRRSTARPPDARTLRAQARV
jgi:hypothetical protein